MSDIQIQSYGDTLYYVPRNGTLVSKNNTFTEEHLLKLAHKCCDRHAMDDIMVEMLRLADEAKLYCTACLEKTIEFNVSYAVCVDKDECKIAAESTNFDNFVTEYVKKNTEVTKAILNIFWSMVNMGQHQYFDPFPAHFLHKKDGPKSNRGELAFLSPTKGQIEANRNYNAVKTLVSQNSVDNIVTKIKTFADDIHAEKELGHNLYFLVRFVLMSNKMDIIYQENMLRDKGGYEIGKVKEYSVNHSDYFNENFKKMSDEKGTMFLFHGSPLNRWFSIMRNGLKIMSGTQLMTTGAAYGNGIYMGGDMSISLGYSGHEGVIGVFEVINDYSQFTNSGGIYVIKNTDIIKLHSLFFMKENNSSAITAYLTDRFRNVEPAIRKAVNDKMKGIGNKRLMRDYEKAFSNTDTSFRVETVGDNISIWNIFSNKKDLDKILKEQMTKLGIAEIKFEIRFPPNYPFSPPFVRVVSPRFVYRTGHITSGGSICMEFLTPKGWSPQCSIESLIVNIISTINSGDAQIDEANWRREYSYDGAVQSFKNIAASYGWL